MHERTSIPVDRAPRTTSPDLFTRLRDQVDSLFDDFGALPSWSHWSGGSDGTQSVTALAPMPALTDIIENEDSYELTVNVPGFKRDQIHISVDDSVLTLQGEMSEEKEEKTSTYHLNERRRGSFTRRFQLPPSVDPEKISANLADGVLHVAMPKTPAAKKKVRQIDVKAA